MLKGDHLITVREAVADTPRSCGTPQLAERTLKGEGDQLPMMQAAVTAVERVLNGMFRSRAAS
jgi:hypothetical protein